MTKNVAYDELPKMKRDTRQKRILFLRKGTAFCQASLFIFDRLSYLRALEKTQVLFELP